MYEFENVQCQLKRIYHNTNKLGVNYYVDITIPSNGALTKINDDKKKEFQKENFSDNYQDILGKKIDSSIAGIIKYNYARRYGKQGVKGQNANLIQSVNQIIDNTRYNNWKRFNIIGNIRKLVPFHVCNSGKTACVYKLDVEYSIYQF